MPTVAQLALAKGFAALKSVHGSAWTFGAAEFLGVATVVSEETVRLSGASGERIRIEVGMDDMPATYPRQGDILTHAGRSHTVISVSDDRLRRITIILVTA